MANKWFSKLVSKPKSDTSWLRRLVTGSLYRLSDAKTQNALDDIASKIDSMRALARDSQVSVALSYYATDATITNTAGDVVWATPIDKQHDDIAQIVNDLLHRWDINTYARDHILELATIGNLYIPTTDLYKEETGGSYQTLVGIDNNTIRNDDFDIIPSYKLPPEDVIDIYQRGEHIGYIYQPQSQSLDKSYIYPPQSIIHFSLGGLLGDYSITTTDDDNNEVEYDIKFAEPLMEQALQPTQTAGLLEDALLLASLCRVVKFVSVECGDIGQDEEINETLQQVKNAIEQQMSLNTQTGDAQSYLNPQSPNNLIYLPMVNGQTPISITDLNMTEATESDNKLLDYYQNKKLSVLGIPKEAMNFSSNEGLGGAGSVLSQRSQLYANALQRLETAYKAGLRSAINTYFRSRNMSGMVDQYELNMQPILTEMSSIMSDRRDSAMGQSLTAIQLLSELGVDDAESYRDAISEILSDVMPQTSAQSKVWSINLDKGDENNGL